MMLSMIDATKMIEVFPNYWMALVATLGLWTWCAQTKASKQIEFLDEFSRTVHEITTLMTSLDKSIKGHFETWGNLLKPKGDMFDDVTKQF